MKTNDYICNFQKMTQFKHDTVTPIKATKEKTRLSPCLMALPYDFLNHFLSLGSDFGVKLPE